LLNRQEEPRAQRYHRRAVLILEAAGWVWPIRKSRFSMRRKRLVGLPIIFRVPGKPGSGDFPTGEIVEIFWRFFLLRLVKNSVY
jgi:hypothetical protein